MNVHSFLCSDSVTLLMIKFSQEFKRTVIKTGSEVMLIGAKKRRRRERKIPGKFRDCSIWPNTDFVRFETGRICGPPEPSSLPGIVKYST